MNPRTIKMLIFLFLLALFIAGMSHSAHSAGVNTTSADNDVAIFLRWLHPEIVYDSIFAIGKIFLMYITPVLLGLAIFTRIAETQLDTLTSTGKWALAIKDMFLWGTVIGLYFSIFGLMAEFANPIYAWLEQYGSLKGITDKFVELATAVRAKQHDDSFVDMLIGVAVGGGQLITFGFYYVSLLLAAAIEAGAKIAYAFLFGLTFIWGLIAIPLAVTSSIKLLRGWGIFVGVVLVWPLVQLLMGGMFTMMFSSAADHVVNDVTVGGVVTVMQVHSLFGVAHLLLAAVIVGAPFIAAQLVSNQSAVASLVTPFFAAAAATAAALFQSHKPIPVPRIPLVPGGNPSSPMQGGPRPVGSPSAVRPGSVAHELGGGGPRPLSPAPVDAATRAASLARNGEFSNSRTPRPKKRSDVLLDAARANRETTTSDTNTNTQAQDSAVGTSVAPEVQQKNSQRSQARRGAIVNQIKKRKET